MSKQASNDDYSDEEAARRRDEVIKRMLNTPPQPRRAGAGDRGALPDHFYVVLDGRMLVAMGEEPPGPAATVDLYRNLDDLREGRVMEPGVKIRLAR